MTYTSAARLLLARFETYLAGVFHPVPQERVVAGAIQSFYTWFFAFLRNAFICICGVLQYLADASGSVTLQIFAIIAYVALAAYCLSYVNVWVLTPFHFVEHKRLGFWLDALVTLAVLLSLGYAILAGTSFAIDEIAKGHAASRTNAPHNSAVRPPGP
jgi:ABC-type proline/glycine betaine transport system permease subunit